MSRLYTPTHQTARELAHLLAQARAAYPATPWREPWRPTEEEEPPPPTAEMEARIDVIIEYYRAGLSYERIAACLGISRPRVSALIALARRNGRWPAELKRRKASAE